MRKLIGFLVCGLAATFLLAGPASAQIGSLDKCQAALEKEMGKLHKDMFLRLNKCVDRVQKEKLKLEAGGSGSYTKGADFCEKMLGKTIDVTAGLMTETGKDKLSKFFAGVTKAGASKCDNSGTAARQDLDDLGLFVGSGGKPFQNAPGAAFDFTKAWLAAQAIQAAWEMQVLANDLSRTRIQDAIDESPKVPANEPVKTNCVAGSVNRPNLCAFNKDHANPQNGLDPISGTFNPICMITGCQLVQGDGSGATTNDSESLVVLSASTIVAPIRGTNLFKVCDLDDNPRIDLQGARLISITSGTGVLEAKLNSEQYTCIRTYRGAGWCDCDGTTGVDALNTFFCQDHFVDPNDPFADSCDLGGGVVGRPEKATEEECVCAPPAELGCKDLNSCEPTVPWLDCTTDADCTGSDICVAKKGKNRCHAGSWTGEQVVRAQGLMGAGDCLIYTTTTLTIVDPTGEEGLDGVPCTKDDEPAEGVDSRIPLTTGSASSVMKDVVGLAWVAQCDTGRVGDHCVEDSNCYTSDGVGTCDTTGSALGPDIQAGPMVGSPLSCGDYDAGDLAGLRLAGAIPFSDGSGLGDGAFAFRFICGQYDPTP
jgi:hypothetical protein